MVSAATNMIRHGLAALFAVGLLAFETAQAQQITPADEDHPPVTDPSKADEVDIAKESQNPIGNLTIMPFLNDTNFGFGPHNATQNILEFEPVVPFHLSADWNLIARAVIPFVWNPSLYPAESVPQAIAPTDASAFFSPRNTPGGWTWGVGPVVQIPTETNPSVGSTVWGLGPTAVIVKTTGPIVAGVLVNNIWSLGGEDTGAGKRYATLLLEPFFNYNFHGGWFVSTAPIVTDNEYGHGNQWTVPVGAVAGRVMKLGKLPIKWSVGGYYNAVTPQYGARWTLQTNFAFIF